MYISLNDLFLAILYILGLATLIYLVIVLHKFAVFITSATKSLNKNSDNIDKLCDSLPTIAENITAISDNLKDVSEVVTETTADVIVAKDSLFSNFEMVKDILNIILSVFSK